MFSPQRSSRILVVLLVASALIGWHALVSTFKLALGYQEYTHILLILPISAALISMQWESIRQFARPSVGLGATLLGIAALIAGASRLATLTPDLRLSLAMLALVICWIGSFALCYGPKVLRQLFFPLGFLLFLVPFPDFMLNAIVGYLQAGSALAARALFGAAGVPIVQDGSVLNIPGLTIEIAKECSSIRSSMMLLVTTLVLAQIFLQSPIKKVLIVAIAIPLSVAKNGLRIFIIAMLGTRVDPAFLHGRLHRQGGVVFFLAALVIVFFELWVLERTERHSLGKTESSVVVSA